MGINILDDQVVKLFNDAPTWFRNSAYGLLVVVASAYFLIPTEIGGVVDEIDAAGERRSASNLMVSAVRGSVRYYVNATNDGTWRMLSPSRFPGTHEIDFRSNRTPLQVIGTISTCYRDFLPGTTIRVNYAPEASGYPIVRVDQNCEMNASDSVVANAETALSFSVISAAVAQRAAADLDLRQINRRLETVSNRPEPALDGHVQTELRAIGIDQEDFVQAQASDRPRDYLERAAVLKSVSGAASVFLYAGSVDAQGDWNDQKISRIRGEMKGSLSNGDVVRADSPIYLRQDYIRGTVFGWKNAKKLGQANPGDTFVIRDSRLIGNHVWVEAVAVDIDD